MGILDGDLAASIYEGFAGELLTGTIRNYTTPESGALDQYGDPVELATVSSSIEGFVENYDAAYRMRAGIPETDMKVNWFAKSAPGIVPVQDSIISMVQAGAATWYQVRRVMADPALALWTCQSFVIPDPDA